MYSPIIISIPEKKLIGKKLIMSMKNNLTPDLWRSFMPRRNEVINKVGGDLISMQVYPSSFDFQNFDFSSTFEKWATVEVHNFDFVPNEMETFIINPGEYAVFHYKGSPTEASSFFGFIFTQWLPQSPYVLDNRPHFEILGEKYKNNDANSEEEVWIPIKSR